MKTEEYKVAYIDGDDIVIRIAIDALPIAYEGAIELGAVAPGYKITDARKFAKEVINALVDEDEQGTTAVHRLFDKAMEDAIENGAEGVEEVEDEEVEDKEVGQE